MGREESDGDVLADGASCGLHKTERLMRTTRSERGLAVVACRRTKVANVQT